jgi:hypothetical protein
MSDTPRSQSQQNPFSASSLFSPEAHMARVESFWAQLGEYEAKALEQQKAALDETHRLSRETMEYGASLAAEWRKASLDLSREAARRAAQLWSNPFASSFSS